MHVADDSPQGLGDLLTSQEGVIRVASALNFMSREALRWRISSGRWQQPCRGIIVAHSGPLTEGQRLWTAVLSAGRDAVLAGLTAARLDGFRGFTDGGVASRPVYLLVPSGQRPRCTLPGLRVVVHYSTMLGPDDVHLLRRPPRTRIARSLVDAAAWMATDRGAQAILAASVQQQLVRVQDLIKVVAGNERLHRRRLITDTLGDIAGGAQALSELDFARLVIRPHKLPEPDRQRRREDPSGRNRYLDAIWDRARLIVEIDGIHHMEPLQYWDDMNRDNDLTIDGYRVLRFPAWVVRRHPDFVAAKIREALGLAG